MGILYHIRGFQLTDQDAARQIILDGLAERWGTLDPTLNHDLDDIWGHYLATGGAFLVAVADTGRLVGTGALSVVSPQVGRIERVSVRADCRGQGLGWAISQALVAVARQRPYRQLVVETTETWLDAVRLYQRCGFVIVARQAGDVHLSLTLSSLPPTVSPPFLYR